MLMPMPIPIPIPTLFLIDCSYCIHCPYCSLFRETVDPAAILKGFKSYFVSKYVFSWQGGSDGYAMT